MNKKELVAAVAEQTGQDRKAVEGVLDSVLDTIGEHMAAGDPVNLPGFAKFARVDRPARMGRNPSTGESIHIAAKSVVKITPLKALKDRALAGGVKNDDSDAGDTAAA